MILSYIHFSLLIIMVILSYVEMKVLGLTIDNKQDYKSNIIALSHMTICAFL